MKSELCGFLTIHAHPPLSSSKVSLTINTVIKAVKTSSLEPTRGGRCRAGLEASQKPCYQSNVSVWSVWLLSRKVPFTGIGVIWPETELFSEKILSPSHLSKKLAAIVSHHSWTVGPNRKLDKTLKGKSGKQYNQTCSLGSRRPCPYARVHKNPRETQRS